MERALLFTESMKQTEGELLVLRWAKALKHIGENMTVYIDDDQLIAGRCGQQGARYGNSFLAGIGACSAHTRIGSQHPKNGRT